MKAYFHQNKTYFLLGSEFQIRIGINVTVNLHSNFCITHLIQVVGSKGHFCILDAIDINLRSVNCSLVHQRCTRNWQMLGVSIGIPETWQSH